MSKCYACKKELPDKDFTDTIESIQEYRERFDDWHDEEMVLICNECDEEREHE